MRRDFIHYINCARCGRQKRYDPEQPQTACCGIAIRAAGKNRIEQVEAYIAGSWRTLCLWCHENKAGNGGCDRNETHNIRHVTLKTRLVGAR